MFEAGDVPTYGLVAWYDFSRPETMAQGDILSSPITANNQAVGFVRDLSGQGNHLTSPFGNQPLYKTAGVNNIGSINPSATGYLKCADNASISLLQGTIFAATQSNGANNGRYIVGKLPSGAATIEYALKTATGAGGAGSAMQLEVKNGSDGTATTAGSPNQADGSPHIWIGQFSNASLSIWMDEKQLATSSTAAVLDGTGDLIIGGDHGANGYVGTIGEVLIFNNILKASRRLTVTSYLQEKWGVLAIGTPTTRTVRDSVDGLYDTYHIDSSRWGSDAAAHNKVSTRTGTGHGYQDSHRDSDRTTAEAR